MESIIRILLYFPNHIGRILPLSLADDFRTVAVCGASIVNYILYGYGILHYLCHYGMLDEVRVLLNNGDLAIDLQCHEKQTGLFFALKTGHLEIAELLLGHGAHPNHQDCNKRTALHFCVAIGCEEGVRLLLRHGADVNCADSDGNTPLHMALYCKRDSFVHLLLHHALKPVDLDKQNLRHLTALALAVSIGNMTIVRLLVDARANLFVAYYAASQIGNLEATLFFFENGANPHWTNYLGSNAFHAAALGGACHIFPLLIENGVKFDEANYEGLTPLYMASERGHIVAVQQLIALGANVNRAARDGMTPLCASSKFGHLELCKLLVAAGADVNHLTTGKQTAIFDAAYYGHVEVVKFLIREKANIHYRDVENRDVLWWACKSTSIDEDKQVGIVELLVSKGADPDVPDHGDGDGNVQTARQTAANGRRAAVCECLNKPNMKFCLVCGDNPRDVVFVPCHDLACCRSCYASMKERLIQHCPKCGKSFVDDIILNTYDVV